MKTGKDTDDDTDESMDDLQASIRTIHEELKATRLDMKPDLKDFKDTFSTELTCSRKDIDNKLNEIARDLKDTTSRVDGAEGRVAEVEEWATAANEASYPSTRKYTS